MLRRLFYASAFVRLPLRCYAIAAAIRALRYDSDTAMLPVTMAPLRADALPPCLLRGYARRMILYYAADMLRDAALRVERVTYVPLPYWRRDMLMLVTLMRVSRLLR